MDEFTKINYKIVHVLYTSAGTIASHIGKISRRL